MRGDTAKGSRTPEPLAIRLRRLVLVVAIFCTGFGIGGYIVFRQNIRPEQLASGRWYGELQNGQQNLRWLTVRRMDGTLEQHVFATGAGGEATYVPREAFWRLNGSYYEVWADLPYEQILNRKLVSVESKRFITVDTTSTQIYREFKTENVSLVGKFLDTFRFQPSGRPAYLAEIESHLSSFAQAAERHLSRHGGDRVTIGQLSSDTESRYAPPESVAGETYGHLSFPSLDGRYRVLTSAGDLVEYREP